jgi:hypothetical protein
MIKLKSKINKQEVYAVDATIKFEFGNKIVEHDVYWASTGEIFPKPKGYSFDEIMSNIYDLPDEVWDSKLLKDQIFINDAPQYNSAISANSDKGIYTNKDIVSCYIKNQLSPVQTKKKKL